MKKKLFSMIMAFALILTSTGIAQANENGPDITQDIPPEVAEVLAEHFICDIIQSGTANVWNENTTKTRTVPLYDENGDLSAYSIELDTNGIQGYVVISIYQGIGENVLEYSEETLPLYDNFMHNQDTKILHLGPLQYFMYDGSSTLISSDNVAVNRNEVENQFKYKRKMDLQNKRLRSPKIDDGTDVDGTIKDVVKYANVHYPTGPYVGYEWKNYYDTYCNYRIQNDYTQSGNICGPVTIINMLEMWGGYHRINSITSKSDQTMMSELLSYYNSKNWFNINDPTQGLLYQYINPAIEYAFNRYGAPVTANSKACTYDNIKLEINAGYLCLLETRAHPTYRSHAMAAFAYNRLRSQTTGNYLSFVKVADTINSSGRYVLVADLSDSNNNKLHYIRSK